MCSPSSSENAESAEIKRQWKKVMAQQAPRATTAGTPMVRWLELLRHNDHIRDVALQLNGQHLEVYEDIVLFGDSVSIERLIPTIERVAKFADRLERRVHGGDDF